MTHDALERLVEILAQLPGVGRRSARRMALRLVTQPAHELLKKLIVAAQETDRQICLCSRCGAVTTVDADPCRLCTDPARDGSLLCVVTQPADVDLIEKSAHYRGRYHVLLGKLSPMQGQGVDNPRLDALVRRVRSEDFREVILALDTDVESEATVNFLRDLLAAEKVHVSRPALGLPAGSGIAYADSITLARAFEWRHEIGD